MSVKMASKYCKHCDKQVLATGEKPNHILHLLLTLVTAGLWIIPWIIISGKSNLSRYRCSQCGSKV